MPNARTLTALVLAALTGALLATALPSLAQSGSASETAAAPVFTECSFMRAGWLPDQAPAGAPKALVGASKVPTGWTPLSAGTVGSYSGVLICR